MKQAVLIFGSETWELSDVMMRAVEGNHTGFIRQINGKRARSQAGDNWETPAKEEVLWAVGIKSVDKYIGLWQEKLAQWVALRPLLEVCAREKG